MRIKLSMVWFKDVLFVFTSSLKTLNDLTKKLYLNIHISVNCYLLKTLFSELLRPKPEVKK